MLSLHTAAPISPVLKRQACKRWIPVVRPPKSFHVNPGALTWGPDVRSSPWGKSDFVLGACLLSFRRERGISTLPHKSTSTFEYINDRLLYPFYVFRWQVDSKKHLPLKLRCWYKYLTGNSNHSIHWTGALILYTWKRFFKQTLSARRRHSLSNKSMPKDTFQKQAMRRLLSCRKSKRNSEAKNKQNREPTNNRAQFWGTLSGNQICFQKTTSIIKH